MRIITRTQKWRRCTALVQLQGGLCTRTNMANSVQSKDTRIVARPDAETQRIIARGAELTGRSTNQFVIYAARKEAMEIERQASEIHVSREGADRMLAALDNPEVINPKLRAAALKQRDLASGLENGRN